MTTYSCPSGHTVLLDDGVVLPGALSIGSHGYAQLCGVEKGRAVLLHRWLLGLEKGDGKIADHINRDVLDNRLVNLRVVTPAQSNLNRMVAARPLPTGVYRTRTGRFQAALKRNRKQITLGTYDTAEEAAQARASALV